ncbi:MAG TPA: methyltransferase [Bacteroidota bacterium]|nr:methyltransferase [Bacteroidota bacterium]
MKLILYKTIAAVILGWLAYLVMSSGEMSRLVLGVVLALSALTMAIIARVQIGKSFAVRFAAKGLVTTGFYSKIRHPLYLFVDLTLLGIVIIANYPILVVIWILSVAGQSVRAWKEENFLRQAYGAEYELYIKNTWF